MHVRILEFLRHDRTKAAVFVVVRNIIFYFISFVNLAFIRMFLLKLNHFSQMIAMAAYVYVHLYT